MRELGDRLALVTGGYCGLGFGIAKALASDGMRVIVTYRDAQRASGAVDELRRASGSRQVFGMALDVTNREEVERCVETVEREHGCLHILCNNAGVNVLGPMDEATYDDWDWILGVNLMGVVNVLVAFLPHMKGHGEGGHIVNVASMAAFISGPTGGVYTASKFAVRGLSECLRYNLAKYRIGVSLVCPGLTRSRMYEAPLKRPARLSRGAVNLTDELIEEMRSVYALGMEPDEVGQKVLVGIKQNAFYVFTHPEFREEIAEISREILDSYVESPSAIEDARRPIENKRKARLLQAKRELEALDRPGRAGSRLRVTRN